MIGNKEILNVSIEDIIPNRFQPRLAFGEKELNELADSIKQHGILQPLLLRKIGEKFEIIAGERRYKAATIAGLNNVPAIIIETDDNISAEIAITENVQRKDLTAIEEAQSYKKLLDRGHTQEDVAKKIGIGQSTVANKLRLLALPEEVQDALLNNRISERHARSLLRLDEQYKQIGLLNRIINEKLTVKQTEDEIDRLLGKEEKVVVPTISEPIETFGVNKEEIFEILDTPKDIEKPIIVEINPEILMPFNEQFIEEKFELEDPIKNEIEQAKEIVEIDSPTESKNFLSVINRTRDFTNNLETEGFKVSTEEFDFEDMYQIVIKIKKDE